MKLFRLEKETLIVFIVSIMIGCPGMLIVSGWALRFPARWALDTNVDSRLNPDNYYLTSQPINVLEPLDSSILTHPAWDDVYLTPRIPLNTNTPLYLTGTPSPVDPTNKLPSTITVTSGAATTSP